jgi:hypothetical protein
MPARTDSAERRPGSRFRQCLRFFFATTFGFRSGPTSGETDSECGEQEDERLNWAETSRFDSNVASDPDALVRVRIHRRFVTGPGESSAPLRLSDIDHIYVLEGSLSKLFPFSGTTVKWLFDVVRLLFGPYCDGHLYASPDSGTEWIKRVKSSNWILVSIYPVNVMLP